MIKLTLSSNGRTLQRTFFQSSVVLGDESDPAVDFPLPFSLGPGDLITIREQGGSFYLSGAAGNRPIASGESIELSEWLLHFEGVAETSSFSPSSCELDQELSELEEFIGETPSEAEVASWLREERPQRRRWLLPALCSLFLLAGVWASLKVTAYQEQRRAAESIAQIGSALHLAAQVGDAPEVAQSRLSSPFLSTQLARLANRGVASDTAEALKREIRNAHYTLKLYTSDDPSRFLLVAAPVDDAPWRVFLKKATLVMSSCDLAVRGSAVHQPWRDLLGWSFSLDKVDLARLQALIHSSPPVLSLQGSTQDAP